ncbi:MAG: hypothetical protein AB1473_09110 [Thermodesulfobacteriota bacterium]
MLPAQTSEDHSSMTWLVGCVLAVWLALVFILGAIGGFVRPPGTVPIPIVLAVATPIIVFLAAFAKSPAFHDFVLVADPRLMAGIQAWRFAGLGFLALYAEGVLPGFFAWPAGLGDIAIGVTAPWIILALIQRPEFKRSFLYVIWNLFGILDLIVAVSTGALSSGLAPGLAGPITTAPMAHLPLVLIPAFLVPIFIMLHLAALFQISGKQSY